MAKPKLIIFCEGDTEYEVLKSFLKPYWQASFRDAQVIHYQGNGELKLRFAQDVQAELADDNTYALCLLDLWGEPFGIYQAGNDIQEGYRQLQAKLYSFIPESLHARFGAFPVVMELETWALAVPDVQKELRISLSQPETIEHPSEDYLDKVFKKRYGARRGYKNAKTTEGKRLFTDFVTAQAVYDDNCPHFQHLIDWLQKPHNPLTISLAPKTSTWYVKQQKLAELESQIQRIEIILEMQTLTSEEKAHWEQQLTDLWEEVEAMDEN